MNSVHERFVVRVLPMVIVGLLVCFSQSWAVTLTAADCISCHSGIGDFHHKNVMSPTVTCTACHVKPDPLSPVLLTPDCSKCHSGVDHATAHVNKIFFSTSSQGQTACSPCHSEFVTTHTSRGLTCATCHKSTDPQVRAAILKGIGPNGKPVYCVDCHNDWQKAYGIHNVNHNGVCLICHNTLPKAPDGTQLGIHSTAALKCVDCHRYGTSDVALNTIFAVPVNASLGEPPDKNYQAITFLGGPCTKCHNQTTTMGGGPRNGCLQCHFVAPKYSYPNPKNNYNGSTSWGHNFRKF